MVAVVELSGDRDYMAHKLKVFSIPLQKTFAKPWPNASIGWIVALI